MHGREYNVFLALLGRHKGKTSLVRPTHRLEDFTKMDLKEIRWDNIDWTHIPQDRIHGGCVHTAMNFWFP
jgi:hypothetical protein